MLFRKRGLPHSSISITLMVYQHDRLNALDTVMLLLLILVAVLIVRFGKCLLRCCHQNIFCIDHCAIDLVRDNDATDKQKENQQDKILFFNQE